MKATEIRMSEARPEHARALEDLFDRCDVACHCRYWHFSGTAQEWLARCAVEPERNREEMREALAAGFTGLVALEGDRAVGWMKLSAVTDLPKLYARPPYRGLPCLGGSREGVLAVACLLVDPARRRRGLARALVREGLVVARGRGAEAVEALPRRVSGEVADAELFTGPESAFTAFEIAAESPQYPVLVCRLE